MKKYKLLRNVLAPAPRYILRLSILEKIFQHQLPLKKFTSIEFGPGLGDVSYSLAKENYCKSITLVDFSKPTLDSLRARFAGYENIHYENNGIDEQPLEKKFDVALAFEVLEHIEEDEKSIKKIYQLLQPEGKFILSVPAYQRKWQKQDEYAGHVRRYEREELYTKLERAGFTDIEILDYGFPLTALMHPFKQHIYKPNTSSSLEERTKKSGTDRPFFSKIPLKLILPLYLPFIFIQRWFINKELGDGFVAVAKKA